MSMFDDSLCDGLRFAAVHHAPTAIVDGLGQMDKFETEPRLSRIGEG